MTNELPFGLTWDVIPAHWHFDGTLAYVVAAPSTDNFVDPAGSVEALNGARAFASAPRKRWQFSVRIAVDFRADFDAGAVMLWSDDRHFAKLCFERSPAGQGTVVSVVTRDVSDDANAWTVDGDSVWLRISNIAADTYVFHSSDDGTHWKLVRYFALSGEGPMHYGIEVQSPIGDGCTASFTEFAQSETCLTNLRDGS